MNQTIKFKASSIKQFSNVTSIPQDDQREIREKLKLYQLQVNKAFEKAIDSLTKDESWEGITNELSYKLETIGEEIKVWEPNECNDKGW